VVHRAAARERDQHLFLSFEAEVEVRGDEEPGQYRDVEDEIRAAADVQRSGNPAGQVGKNREDNTADRYGNDADRL